ncbi:MAG: ABC-2 family transporter protein [Candidatus Nanoarchaeia archaeon]
MENCLKALLGGGPMKFWRIWKGWFKLELSAEMAYRLNFLLKAIAFITFDFFGPILALVVYSVSKGLPGWSFEEFLLLQGTFILSTGLLHLFFMRFAVRVIDNVREGTYDIMLVKPANPLLLSIANGSDIDGLPRTIVGASIAAYSLIKMGWAFDIVHLFSYCMLILAALLFLLSLQVIIAAMSFLFVKSFTLWNIVDVLTDIGKNPITVFGPMGMLIFTFVLPIGLVAFYPASAILGKIAPLQIFEVVVVALAFFGFSALLWNLGIRKYASAGG